MARGGRGRGILLSAVAALVIAVLYVVLRQRNAPDLLVQSDEGWQADVRAAVGGEVINPGTYTLARRRPDRRPCDGGGRLYRTRRTNGAQSGGARRRRGRVHHSDPGGTGLDSDRQSASTPSARSRQPRPHPFPRPRLSAHRDCPREGQRSPRARRPRPPAATAKLNINAASKPTWRRCPPLARRSRSASSTTAPRMGHTSKLKTSPACAASPPTR